MPTIRPSPPSVSSVAADGVETVGIERAEALVEEDRVELGGPAGGEHRDLVGERERQRGRSLEGLATRQGLDRPALVGVAVVDDLELVAVVDRERVLAARQLLERRGRSDDQRLQRLVDDPLLEAGRSQEPRQLARDVDLFASRRDALRDRRLLLDACGDTLDLARRPPARAAAVELAHAPDGRLRAIGTSTPTVRHVGDERGDRRLLRPQVLASQLGLFGGLAFVRRLLAALPSPRTSPNRRAGRYRSPEDRGRR